MTRRRPSRAERRERTAQRLLDAAVRLIARRGLLACSIEDFAEAAGYSRGAFYSNFRSKEELLLTVLRRDQQQVRRDLTEALKPWRSVDQIWFQMRGLHARLHRNGNSFLVWTEARLLSARNPKFRAGFAALIVQRRALVAKFVDLLYQHAGRTPYVALDSLAMGFLSLIEGVRLVVASRPDEMAPEMAENILEYFVDGVLWATDLSTRT